MLRSSYLSLIQFVSSFLHIQSVAEQLNTLSTALAQDDDTVFLYFLSQHRNPLPTAQIPRINFDIATWDPRICYEYTRFWPNEIARLHTVLGFPDVVCTNNRLVESGQTVLTMLLCRLSRPTKYFDLVTVFGRDSTAICRFVLFAQSFIYDNWKHLLDWDTQRLTPAVLKGFAKSLRDDVGCPLDNCCGFADGTCWCIARPTYNQEQWYTGHKRDHVAKLQAVVTPDGITVHLSELCLGRRTDARIYRESGLDTILRTHAKGHHGRQLCLYANQGYAHSSVMHIPYGKSYNMPRYQKDFNIAMSGARIQVEHEFGKTQNFFRFTQYVDNLRFYVSPLEQVFHVGTLLKNALVCLERGNTVAPIMPPTLEQYFHH